MSTKTSFAKIHDVIVEDLEFGQVGDVPLLAQIGRASCRERVCAIV